AALSDGGVEEHDVADDLVIMLHGVAKAQGQLLEVVGYRHGGGLSSCHIHHSHDMRESIMGGHRRQDIGAPKTSTVIADRSTRMEAVRGKRALSQDLSQPPGRLEHARYSSTTSQGTLPRRWVLSRGIHHELAS